ncbi:MAG TPA: Inactivated superfamily I helicase, partial [Betaproteobacteria bacterium]|nr:Inactivated superfamily I helicase [Betaproteobacteria bacterium]
MKNHSAPAGVIAATLDGAPLEAAAAYLMARERSALPDWSPITVLLPTLYPAAEFSAALGHAANRPTVLLPRITTLKAWAEHVPIEPRILANSQREALLYQALKAIDWLQGADRWQISAELLTLFDELTTSQIALPLSFDAFLQQLETAYRGSSGAPLHFEATLVHRLWFAMVRGAAAEIDPAAAYLMQLSRLATQVSAPVYAIGLYDLAPAENAFLTNVAQRHPVIQLHSAGNDPAHELLAAAWANPEHNADLRSRALACRTRHPHSPLQGKLALFAATGLEQEAQAIDVKVRQWLLAGKKRIAVIVQDRLV